MAKKKKVRKMSHRQTLALASMLTGLVPTGVDADVADGWIQRPKVFRRVVGGAIRKAICTPVDDSDFNRKCDEAVSQADRELGALDAEVEIDAGMNTLNKRAKIFTDGLRAGAVRLGLTGNSERLAAEAKLGAKINEPPVKKTDGFLTRYDQSFGLWRLVKRAIGPIGNVDSNITPERFPITGTDVRTVKLRVEPFALFGEDSGKAAAYLTAIGYTLANIGDLAGFMYSHLGEVEEWNMVVALSEDSRWADHYGNVYVPFAKADSDQGRCFGIISFLDPFYSNTGVLVICD